MEYSVGIIGGGQAGITIGYYLKKVNIPFIIIDKHHRVGESWRNRYESLVLFTPHQYSVLPGLQMKGLSKKDFPTKDEMADYLEDYVQHYNIPMMLNTTVDKLKKEEDGSFFIETNKGRMKTQQVIVASGAFQQGFIPDVTKTHTEAIQLHSSEYRSPADASGNEILVVGGGNSGAQIAVELSKSKNVTIAVSHQFKFLPLSILGISIFSLLEKTGLLYAGADTIKGKWFRKQKDPIFGKELQTLIKNQKITVKPRVVQVGDKGVVFEDQTLQKFDSIIWATGFVPSYEWIQIEHVTHNGKPVHNRGIADVKGLYFIGLPWQHQRGSALICGVSKDAEYLAQFITAYYTDYKKTDCQ
ncbi:flavin-containing monooxygenase [Cytobacillus gottheilii]|uniref:flavin-containing monooxygenase n=1 Tax=Cytobacillus gottheilii TaxID=859144 RepID=UPI000836867B|nr:NAD(P)-binding domain-containing protein [Cytobacillus gottheilii]